jgi:hypothetical protein
MPDDSARRVKQAGAAAKVAAPAKASTQVAQPGAAAAAGVPKAATAPSASPTAARKAAPVDSKAKTLNDKLQGLQKTPGG